MAISDNEVKSIARLARIDIDDGDIPAFSTQLNHILEFIAQMNEADTDGVEPLAHPMELDLRMRPDAVLEQNQRENFQKTAPRVDSGLYLVPKVIE